MIDDLLNRCFQELRKDPDPEIIRELASRLSLAYDCARRRSEVGRLKAKCLAHPIANLLCQDPLTNRARNKPRGYPGDAVLIDYFYRPDDVDPRSLSPVGAAIFEVTARGPHGLSVRWRQEHLAMRIRSLPRDKPQRIFAVASGHLRELDLLEQFRNPDSLSIVALDHDAESLNMSREIHSGFNIQEKKASVTEIIRNRASFGFFNLIYAAGLFDYLGDRFSAKLIENLCKMLLPGGVLVIGNFTPWCYGRGFMTAFMDWELNWRDERQLAALVATDREFDRVIYQDELGNVCYLSLTRNT